MSTPPHKQLVSPKSRQRRVDARPGRLFVPVLCASLLAYNNRVCGFIPAAWYVPANLLVAAALLIWARRQALGLEGIGLGRGDGAVGVRWGLRVVAGAALAMALALSIPGLRAAFEDERVAGIGYGLLAYRTLVRIPLGTVVLEEVAFRGVLLEAWSRLGGRTAALIGSSVVFGLWHVRPALDLVRQNGLGESDVARWAVVAGAAVAASIAGAGFGWLRERTQSLIAPMVAHAGINSLATVAAFVALQLA